MAIPTMQLETSGCTGSLEMAENGSDHKKDEILLTVLSGSTALAQIGKQTGC